MALEVLDRVECLERRDLGWPYMRGPDPLMDMLKRIKRGFICPFWKSQAAERRSGLPGSVAVMRFPVGELVGIKRNRPQEKVRHVPVSCLETALRRHGGRRRCRCGPGSCRVDPSDNAHRYHSRRDRGRQRETGSNCFVRARERHRNVRSRRRRWRGAGRPGCEERALSRDRTAQPRWPRGRVRKTPSAWRRRRRWPPPGGTGVRAADQPRPRRRHPNRSAPSR